MPKSWNSLSLQEVVTGVIKDPSPVEAAQSVFGTVKDLIQVVMDFLDLIKSLIVGFDNPFQAILQLILEEIRKLIQDLRATGIYELAVLPDMQKDPDLSMISKGYSGFVGTVVSSMGDYQDPNRPQFSEHAYMGGVVVLFAISNLAELIKSINNLYVFMKRSFGILPAAPVNLTASLAADGGNPFLKFANELNVVPLGETASVGVSIQGTSLEWSLPSVPVRWLMPDWFLIERCSVKQGHGVSIKKPVDTYQSADGVSGTEQHTYEPVKFMGKDWAMWDRVAAVRPTWASGMTGSISQFGGPAALALTGVEYALSGGLAYICPEENYRFWDHPNDGAVPTPYPDPDNPGKNLWMAGGAPYAASEYASAVEAAHKAPVAGTAYSYRVRSVFGSTDAGELLSPVFTLNNATGVVTEGGSYVLSEPSNVASVLLPRVPENFDVWSSVYGTLKAAYALGFYLDPSELSPDQQLLGIGAFPEIDFRHKFDYLIHLPSWVSSLEWWDTTVSTIETGLSLYRIRGVNKLYRNQAALDAFAVLYSSHKAEIESLWGEYTQAATSSPVGTAAFVTGAYAVTSTPAVRETVVKLVAILRGVSEATGTPPNWTAVRLLDDLIPFVDQIIAQLQKKIKALFDLYGGIVKEVIDFISFLQKRVALLLDIIEMIEQIILLLLSLDFGFYILNIPADIGGVRYFSETLQSATGAPSNGPNGLTAGMVWAYGSASMENLTAVKSAFTLLFG
jgi:hypothetical protein